MLQGNLLTDIGREVYVAVWSADRNRQLVGIRGKPLLKHCLFRRPLGNGRWGGRNIFSVPAAYIAGWQDAV